MKTDPSPTVTTAQLPAQNAHRKFPNNLPDRLNLIIGQDGKSYAILDDAQNPYCLPVGSRLLDNKIREIARENEMNLSKKSLADTNDFLQAHAESANVSRDVWCRVAPIANGIMIDVGDQEHTQIKITADGTEIVRDGSEVLFFRSQISLPMVMPAEQGDLKLLEPYLNLHPSHRVLFLAWLTYTMAHPKVSSSKFVILVLFGGQGSGKSSLCENIILKLIDPSRIGVQILPKSSQDFAIAANNSHVLCFDNVRGFSHRIADLLCTASTGGAISTRKLYSNAEQAIINFHVGLVLNGIHPFVDQPDLAQRCLPLELLPIPEDKRRSDSEIEQDFKNDLPAIQRGLFDLIAAVFKHLPTVKVTNPERMIDFSKWLAAMEKVDGTPEDIYQIEYSEVLNQGQLDALMDNPLAAAVIKFSGDLTGSQWVGSPSELLDYLDGLTNDRTVRSSREWPLNTIALSKRLIPLKAGLLTQGIEVVFSRGKHRKISICLNEDYNREA